MSNKQCAPQLFGARVTTDFIVGVARFGPCSGRRVAREMNIDPARVPALRRRFQSMGLIRTSLSGEIVLNESFFAFCEATVLLHALAGQRVIVVPDSNRSDSRGRLANLFGTACRTRVLVAISSLGESNIEDLSFASGTARSTTRAIVRHFQRCGIMRSHRSAQNLVIGLDPTWIHAPLLANLLTRLREAFPRIARAADAQQMVIEDRARLAQRDEVAMRSAMPFGTGPQGRALVALARQRALTTATLASTMGCSHGTARAAARSLEQHGLVVTAVHGSGPTSKRWIALNESHPLTAPIRLHAARLSRATRSLLLAPKSFKAKARVRPRGVPGPPLRLDVLLETYSRREIDVPTLARSLRRSDHASIRRWAERLEAEGLIEYGVVDGRMTLRASTDATMRALVEAVRRHVNETAGADRQRRKRIGVQGKGPR